MLTEALKYAARGWAIFPVEHRGKRPLTKHGVKDATTDPEIIRSWWHDYEQSNIGLATGASGLVVIDIDDIAAAQRLPSIPLTLTARTGSGGFHLFYAAPDWPLGPTVGKLPGVGDTPGIDLRAGDSYVILPPSIHPSGNEYVWADKYPIAPCPRWLRPAPPKPRVQREIKNGTTYAKAALRLVVEQVRTAPEGQRNHTLNAAVFPLKRFIEAGELDLDEVTEAVSSAASEAGLEPREIQLTLRSALH
jgi:hypothetical protein